MPARSRRRLPALLALILAALAGCSGDPAQQIIGRWESQDTGSDLQFLEFHAPNVLKIQLKGDSKLVDGTYQLAEGKLKADIWSGIQARLDERVQDVGTNSVVVPFWVMTQAAVNVSVTGSQLAITDQDKPQLFKRVN